MVTEQPTDNPMRDRRINDISQQVGRGEYRVDTQAVASAILRRLLGGADGLPAVAPPQEPCS